MTQLRYIGTLAVGTLKTPGFSIGVRKNEVYDIPESVVPSLLQTGAWETVREVKKTKEKIFNNQKEDLFVDGE
jgi:hypothetical protein